MMILQKCFYRNYILLVIQHFLILYFFMFDNKMFPVYHESSQLSYFNQYLWPKFRKHLSHWRYQVSKRHLKIKIPIKKRYARNRNIRFASIQNWLFYSRIRQLAHSKSTGTSKYHLFLLAIQKQYHQTVVPYTLFFKCFFFFLLMWVNML